MQLSVKCGGAGSAAEAGFVSHPAFQRALTVLHRHVLPGVEADEEAELQESVLPREGVFSACLLISEMHDSSDRPNGGQIHAQPLYEGLPFDAITGQCTCSFQANMAHQHSHSMSSTSVAA